MSEVILEFTIGINPRTKKNGQQIYVNRRTEKPFVSQNDTYKAYEASAWVFMPRLPEPISFPVNVQAVYYRKKKGIVDLNGLNQCLHDVLVYYGVLADDNYKIVAGTDGSRVKFDTENPRTEVTITRMVEE